MGFLDKVKEVGNQAATSVNQAVNKGQQQFDEQKMRKHADAVLRDLGALVYQRDTGRADASADSAIAALVGQLQELEAAGTPVDLSQRAGAAPAPAAPAVDGGTPPPAPGAVAPPPAPGAVAPPPAPGAVAPPPPPGTVGGQ